MSSHFRRLHEEPDSGAPRLPTYPQVQMVPLQQYRPVIQPREELPVPAPAVARDPTESTLKKVVRWETCIGVVSVCLLVVGFLQGFVNFLAIFVVPVMAEEYEVANEDFAGLFVAHAICKSIAGWLIMAIGCHGLKAIRNRTPRHTRRMLKRSACAIAFIILLSALSLFLFAEMVEKGGPLDEWDDRVFVEDNNIYYYESDDVISGYGSVSYTENGMTVNIDMSWQSEQGAQMDWNSFFYDLFEKGDDMQIPEDANWTITIIDSNGQIYDYNSEQQNWYDPPYGYPIDPVDGWDNMDQNQGEAGEIYAIDEEEEEEERHHHDKEHHKEKHHHGRHHDDDDDDDDDEHEGRHHGKKHHGHHHKRHHGGHCGHHGKKHGSHSHEEWKEDRQRYDDWADEDFEGGHEIVMCGVVGLLILSCCCSCVLCCFKRYHMAVVRHTRTSRSVARQIQHAPIQVAYIPQHAAYQPPEQARPQVPAPPPAPRPEPQEMEMARRPVGQYMPPQGVIQQPRVQLG